MAASKRTVTLFLLALFFVLAIAISAWISGIYRSANTYSERTAHSSVLCSEYALSAGILEYSDSRLVILIKSASFSEQMLKTIVIKSGKELKEVAINLEPGMEKTIELNNFSAGQTVILYPPNCEAFKITCDVTDKSCDRAI